MSLASWEYIINLSVYDLPLRNSQQIHKYLVNPERKNNLWMDMSIYDNGLKILFFIQLSSFY